MLSVMYVHTVTWVCLAYLRAGSIASVTSGPMPPEYCLPEAGRQHRDIACGPLPRCTRNRAIKPAASIISLRHTSAALV